MTSKLFDRVGCASATTGAGTLTIGAALGAVPLKPAPFSDFTTAGVTSGDAVSYLIFDNGAFEFGTGVATLAAGVWSLTRVLGRSSTGSLLNLSGNEQVFLVARAEDLAAVGGGPGGPDQSIQYNNNGAFGGLSFLVKSGPNSLQVTGVLNVDNYLNNATRIELNNNAQITLFDTSSLTYTSVAQLSSPLHGNNSNNGLMLAGAGATTLDSSDGGFLQASELQESNTTNRTITYDDLETSFDNTGASGEVDFTLPDPTQHVKGQVYSFCVTAAQTEKIIATGGAKIYRGGTVTGANGNISSSTVGSFIRLVSRDFGAGAGYSGTDWVAESITGTWA